MTKTNRNNLKKKQPGLVAFFVKVVSSLLFTNLLLFVEEWNIHII